MLRVLEYQGRCNFDTAACSIVVGLLLDLHECRHDLVTQFLSLLNLDRSALIWQESQHDILCFLSYSAHRLPGSVVTVTVAV